MLALLASFLIPRPDAANAATGGPKPPARPNLNVVVIGDFYSYGYATSAEPALQKSAPPTLQALNQIQAANRAVNVNVLFIPVSAATSTSLFQPASLGTSSARLTLISAVRRASTVIVGVGGGNATLAESLRSVLFGGAVSAKAFSQLMANFDNGSYLRAQIALLDAIAARAAPGMSIVTLGYPTMLGEQLPSGFTWFSPFTWTAVSQQRANMSDQLVSALNTANEEATSIAGAGHPGLRFLYANLSAALHGLGSFSLPQGQRHNSTAASARGSQAATMEQTIIGNDLLPYVSQAVNDEFAARNLPAAQSIPPVTPTSRWRLAVLVAPQLRPQPQRPISSSGGSTPPRNSQDNPAYQPPWLPAWPANPPPLAWWPQAPRPGGPSISTPSVPPVAPSLPVGTGGTGDQHQGNHGQLPDTNVVVGPPAPQHQSPGTGQPTQGSGPTGSGGRMGPCQAGLITGSPSR
jgi:hypothetical protein